MIELLMTLALGTMQSPLTESVMGQYRLARMNLIETAEAMPEERYKFRLTPEQRTFGEWLAHTAVANYRFCASINGAAPPETKRLEGLEGKRAIEQALLESFEYCDAALEGMTDARALRPVKTGAGEVYPVQAMIGLIVSTNQHYGNLVGYLRTSGVTPPSTARRQKEISLPSRPGHKKK